MAGPYTLLGSVCKKVANFIINFIFLVKGFYLSRVFMHKNLFFVIEGLYCSTIYVQ